MDVTNDHLGLPEAGTCDTIARDAIEVWVVDDHRELRDAVAQCLNLQDNIVCTRQFGSGEEVLSALDCGDLPHVILLDINLAASSGLDFVRPIKTLAPEVRVLMYTTFSDSLIESMAYDQGADGFLLKRQEFPEIAEAICYSASAQCDRELLFPGCKHRAAAVSVPPVPAACQSKRASVFRSLRALLAL